MERVTFVVAYLRIVLSKNVLITAMLHFFSVLRSPTEKEEDA